MFDLLDLGNVILEQSPLINIKIEGIQIDIKPSKYFPFPVIHIDAKLDIRLGF